MISVRPYTEAFTEVIDTLKLQVYKTFFNRCFLPQIQFRVTRDPIRGYPPSHGSVICGYSEATVRFRVVILQVPAPPRTVNTPTCMELQK